MDSVDGHQISFSEVVKNLDNLLCVSLPTRISQAETYFNISVGYFTSKNMIELSIEMCIGSPVSLSLYSSRC